MESSEYWSEHVAAVFARASSAPRQGSQITPVELAIALLLEPGTGAVRWLETQDFDVDRALIALGHVPVAPGPAAPAPVALVPVAPVPGAPVPAAEVAAGTEPDVWSAPDAVPGPGIEAGPPTEPATARETAPEPWSAPRDWSAPESWAVPAPVPGSGSGHGVVFSLEAAVALKVALRRGMGRFGTVDLLAGLLARDPVRGVFAEQGVTARMLPATETTRPAERPYRKLIGTVVVVLLLVIVFCILGPIVF
jgi:hypothetical protein